MTATMSERDRGPWIQVASGGRFYFDDPQPEDVRIEDIAQVLSMVPRFAGHTFIDLGFLKRPCFYSVGQHSVYVSRLVEAVGGTTEEQLWGLLHDASEAYACDIPSPLKHMGQMHGYRLIESNIMRAVMQRFGLGPEMPEIVRQADAHALRIEAEHMSGRPDWCHGVQLLDLGAKPDPFIGPVGGDFELIQDIFMARFDQLTGRV